MTQEFSTIIDKARVVLERRNVAWALLGGWAVSVRTEPRFTRDIDLAVAIRSDSDAESLVQELSRSGFEISTIVEQDSVHRLATVRLVTKTGAKGLLLDLLFASSGIEPEICAGAERMEILPNVYVPVARAEHLLALKILSRDDRTRPQDAGDIRALLGILDEQGLETARKALALISKRGYHRGRDLESALKNAIREFS